MKLRCTDCGNTEVFDNNVTIHAYVLCSVNADGTVRCIHADEDELREAIEQYDWDGEWICNPCGSMNVVDEDNSEV